MAFDGEHELLVGAGGVGPLGGAHDDEVPSRMPCRADALSVVGIAVAAFVSTRGRRASACRYRQAVGCVVAKDAPTLEWQECLLS